MELNFKFVALKNNNLFSKVPAQKYTDLANEKDTLTGKLVSRHIELVQVIHEQILLHEGRLVGGGRIAWIKKNKIRIKKTTPCNTLL